MRFVTILFVFLLAFCVVQGDDTDFFKRLYAAVADIVAPSTQPSGDSKASPGLVFLMELPGLAVGRDDLDADYWQAKNFVPRIPDAVFADFVDRAPKYLDTTFIDSGAKISKLWKLFMNSYKVPPNDDPAQTAAVEKAMDKLENSTVEADFLTALQRYQEAQVASTNFRTQCLAEQSGSICAYLQTTYELSTSVAWFNMETRRRSLLGYQATILTLQSADLKSVFADALQTFERSARVDVGAEGFGSQYYNTFAQPRNWWSWFPVSGYAYDMVAYFDTSVTPQSWVAVMLFSRCKAGGIACPVVPTVPGEQVFTDTGSLGTASVGKCNNEGTEVVSSGPADCFIYRPNPGASGSDSFSVTLNNVTTVQITVGISGAFDAAAQAAFVKVATSSSSSSSEASSSYSSVNVNVNFRVRVGLVKVGGSTNVNVANSRQSFSSESSDQRLDFSIARVNIIRPWLNPLLLAFQPVGMYGIAVGTWSDGSGLPSTNGADLKLPLIPTSFIVARQVTISMKTSSTSYQAAQSAVSTDSSLSVSYGPFFSGNARVSTSNGKQSTSTQSKATANGLYIEGPQVIGWVCTPTPLFPNADYRADVFKYRSTE